MCGIIGLFPYQFDNGDLNPIIKSIVMRRLFTESLTHMQPRGKDSTGVSVLWNDGEVAVLKQAVHAEHFVIDDGLFGEDYINPNDKEANFKWLTDTWLREDIKLAIGHVRAGTKGSEYNPHNNHPIIVQDIDLPDGGKIEKDCIIGVHNGGIRNDNELEKKHGFQRKGEVDSEVIFQLISKYKSDFTIDKLKGTFQELEGAYSIMAFNPTVPNKIACMREVRPLNAAYIKELGVLILISERKYLQEALNTYERWRIREGALSYSFTDNNGTVHDLGSIYDNFPYITVEWYNTTALDTMESGVFILDLDTKVDDKTKVKDLVSVQSVVNKTIKRSGYNATDRRSAYNKYSKTNSKTEYSKSEKASTVNDLTNYDDDCTDYSDEKTVEVTIAELSAPESADDIEVDASAESECPWSWEERVQMGNDFLYSEASECEDNFTLTKLDGKGVQELLSKYLISAKTPKDAATTLAIFYDIIFPEGYAAGFAVGYDLALSDMAEVTEEDPDIEKLKAKVEELKKKIDKKENVVTADGIDLKKYNKLVRSKNKAQSYISSMRPLLSVLLRKQGVVDEEGNVDIKALEELKQDAGIKARPNMANLIKHKIIYKG